MKSRNLRSFFGREKGIYRIDVGWRGTVRCREQLDLQLAKCAGVSDTGDMASSEVERFCRVRPILCPYIAQDFAYQVPRRNNLIGNKKVPGSPHVPY